MPSTDPTGAPLPPSADPRTATQFSSEMHRLARARAAYTAPYPRPPRKGLKAGWDDSAAGVAPRETASPWERAEAVISRAEAVLGEARARRTGGCVLLCPPFVAKAPVIILCCLSALPHVAQRDAPFLVSGSHIPS